MKKCMLIILAVASLSNANSLSVNKPLRHSIQLKVKDFIAIGSLYSTFISYKQHFNTTSAVRVGAGFNADQGITENVFENPVLPSGLHSSESAHAAVSLFAQYLNYPVRRNNLWLYYGIGPSGDVTYEYNEHRYFDSPRSDWEKTKSYSGGLIGLGGIEWIFSKQFSLFTEYSVFAKYTYSKKTSGGNDAVAETSTRKYISFNYDSVYLGISIYF